MFGRRETLSILRRVKEFVWPSLGWRRAARYAGHRLSRLPGSPYRIAAGIASGAAVSFTPLVGFHFIAAALLALAVRGNVIASAIGTAVGNPWTFPFIWAWTFATGRWLLGEQVSGIYPELLTLEFIFETPLHIMWPMAVGSLPTAIVVWFVVFLPARSMVAQYQRARRWRLKRKVRMAERRAERRAAKAAKAAARREPAAGAVEGERMAKGGVRP